MMTETAVRKTTRKKRGTKPKVMLPEAEGPGPERRRLSRADYHRAAELGIFGPDERLELIHGEVYQMSPQSRRHARGVMTIAAALEEAFGEGFHVQQQLPLATEDSEPEPDIAVITGEPDDFKDQHPPIHAAALIVEIADTSLKGDRGLKAALYAEAGVKDYWIVNLNARCIEVYREPAALPDVPNGHGYKSMRLYTEGESLSPLARPEAEITVVRLLPAL
jgi:Uma2 family endonuclease